MTEPTPLDEDQQLYEAVFGHQPEWHTADDPAALAPTTTPEEDEDEALYRALFGA